MRTWIVALVLSLSGCSIYQPMVGHTITKKAIEKYDVKTCISQEFATTAVKRACLTRDEIESARSENVLAHNVAIGLLIPAAGLVTYRAARQKAGASTLAIAAGGIAAYETLGALAPDNRIDAYDRGIQALTCALGDYRIAVVSVPLAYTQRAAYENDLKSAMHQVETLNGNASIPNTKVVADRANLAIAAIQTAVETQSATGLVDAQLDKFVGLTVDDLNGLLRGTLPSLNSIGESIAALETIKGAPPAAADGAPPPLLNSTAIGTSNGASNLIASLTALQQSSQALIKAEAGNRASVDFTHCLMATTALEAAGLYKPMALGPANSTDNSTLDIPKGETQRIALVGGQQPYSTNVSGDTAKAPLPVKITMQGAILLEIGPTTSNTQADLKYVVEVYDALGTKRSVNIIVPKG